MITNIDKINISRENFCKILKDDKLILNSDNIFEYVDKINDAVAYGYDYANMRAVYANID